MNKNVLFISRGGFSTGAIVRSLEEEGLSVTEVSPNISEIAANEDGSDLVMLYLSSDIENFSDFFQYLRGLVRDRKKYLVLLGNEKDIEFAENSIPQRLILAEMKRPIDVSALLDEILPEIAAREQVPVESILERRKSILLVDDDGTFLKMMKGWLSPYYRVTIVSSGTQAILYLANNRPDLILLDYNMPVTSGPKTLEMIRSENKTKEIPVIFLTGKNDRESVMKVLSLKPDGYLLKSIGRDAVLEAVSSFFRTGHTN